MYPVAELGEVIESCRVVNEDRRQKAYEITVNYGTGNIIEEGSIKSIDYLYDVEKKFFNK